MKRLLDTNAYAAMRAGDEATLDLIRDAEEIIFSMIVIGELLHGFRNGNRRARNIALLDDFLTQSVVTVVSVTRTTAEWFGETMTTLRRAGTPIPTNDVWIAAQCFESGAELITFDSDFTRVPGLLVRMPSALL